MQNSVSQGLSQQRADAFFGLSGRQEHQLFQCDRAADAHAEGMIAPRQRSAFQQKQGEHGQNKQRASGQQAERAAVPEKKEVADA